MKSGNFIIHVVGSNPNINGELNKMASTKQVGNQKIEIKASTSVDASIQPHIIFLLNERYFNFFNSGAGQKIV